MPKTRVGIGSSLVLALGKAVRRVSRLRRSGVGGGSAFPGLIVETISPNLAPSILNNLPYGVVLISGTNGKTTTTKIVSEILVAQGLRVFSNTTGSNYMRGVISSLLGEVSLSGQINADIAVLELDEAHAVSFVRHVQPRYSLLLNVMRDQMDRFGEIDYTADLLSVVAAHTTNAVVLNRHDCRLASLSKRERPEGVPPVHSQKMLNEGERLTADMRWFGFAPELASVFLQDDELWNAAGHKDAPSQRNPALCKAEAVLSSADGAQASFVIDGKEYHTKMQMKGAYNALNAAAALALVRTVLSLEGLANSSINENLVSSAGRVEGAFGRSETIFVDGKSVELVLVKNPGGFRLALDSYNSEGYDTAIAINDQYMDGCDMSWLYDVSFKSLRSSGVQVVSGIRAYDMALRLAYEEVPVRTIECNLKSALKCLLAQRKNASCRLYCTYSAMLEARKQLLSMNQVVEVNRHD